MQRLLSAITIAFIGCGGDGLAPVAGTPPPATARSEQVDHLHGRALADPYRWLEEVESERVVAWARAQDRFARAILESNPERLRRIRESVAAGADADDKGVPLRRGEDLYYMLSAARYAHPVLVRESLRTNATELLVDPGAGAVVRDFRPDPTGRRLAYALQDAVTGETVWRFRDLESGRETESSLTGARIHGEPWSPDGERFLFYRPPQREDASAARIYWEDPGGERPPQLVYEHAEAPQARVVPDLTTDGRFLILTLNESSNENRILIAPLEDPLARRFEPFRDQRGTHTYVGSRGSTLYFLTTYGSPKGRLLSIDLGGASPTPSPVVAETEHALGQAYLFGERLLAVYSVDGFEVVTIFDLEGSPIATVEPPKGLLWNDYPVGWPPFAGGRDSVAYFRSIALVGAGVYEIDLADGTTRQISSRGERIDASAFSLRRVSCESADGVRVPMTLVSRADVDLEDSPPVLIHVYGAYGLTWVPYFNPMFRTFLAAGGMLAVPDIRGGGIYGQGWYEAGRGIHKIHSVDDTVAAARWLLANGHSKPGRLAVLGNSAGSIPAAVAAITHPELFGALLVEVPLADMVRYRLWTESWNTEFAAPDTPEGLAAALAVSPYHLLRERSPLPAAMITAGDRDRVAFVAHAYKLAAALQRAQSAEHVPLLHVDWGTGHGGDKTARQRIDTWSYELAFLFDALGMEPK